MAQQADDRAVRQVLAHVGDRAADLIASIDDMNRPVPGLDWTVGQVAAHMLIAVRGNATSMRGSTEQMMQMVPDVDGYSGRMAAMTSSTLAAEPQRDAKAAAQALREAVATFIGQAQQQSPDDAVQTPWYGSGATLPVDLDTRLMIGELLVHGLDISRGIRAAWPLPRDEILVMMPAFYAMMPRVFKPESARDVSATFRIRMRGGDSTGVRIDKGTLEIAPWGTWNTRPTCILSADPVAFFLLGYGRASQWSLIAQGRLLSYGRKPWQALTLRSLFVNP